MSWMDECIKHVGEHKPIIDVDKNFDVMCRAAYAKGFLSQCEGYEEVVALLDAILEPVKERGVKVCC